MTPAKSNLQVLEGTIRAALVTPDLRHAGAFHATFLVVRAGTAVALQCRHSFTMRQLAVLAQRCINGVPGWQARFRRERPPLGQAA